MGKVNKLLMKSNKISIIIINKRIKNGFVLNDEYKFKLVKYWKFQLMYSFEMEMIANTEI